MPAEELFAQLGLPSPESSDLVAGAWSVHLDADAALDAWRTLWERWPQTGWCPVLISADPAEDYYSPEDANPQDAESLDPVRVFADLDQRVSRTIAPGSGPLPSPAERPSLIAELDEVQLVITQTPKPWLWPALVGYLGPVNLGIGPAEVSAVLHRWFDYFGAVPCYLGDADMELVVANPPQDERTALIVAAEHGILAPDELEGTTLIERTAVVRSHRWSFWWD